MENNMGANTITTITDEIVYRAALTRVEALWDAEPGSPDGLELESLYDLVEAYEAVYYPIDPPSRAVMKDFRRDQMTYKPDIVLHPKETILEAIAEKGLERTMRFQMLPMDNFTALMKYMGSDMPEPMTFRMASDLEGVTEIPKQFWLNLDRNYQEWLAEEKKKHG